MTNGEKYKTAQDRIEAMDKWCKERLCENCVLHGHGIKSDECAFHWLDLESYEEKPLPCPFCGEDAKEDANSGGVHFVVCDCGYSSIGTSDKLSAISAHNRVAKAVMESEAS